MKTELKAKLLQHLAKNKKQNAGFTLIELLVVVIIIGVLAAIALPNFLNQSAKAKQSEAKTTIGSVNSAQTAYRQENASFATSMTQLALGLPDATTNYTYAFTGSGTDIGIILATKTDSALKHYAGAAARRTESGQSIINSVICEADTTTTAQGTPTGGGTNQATCPGSFTRLGAPAAATPAASPN